MALMEREKQCVSRGGGMGGGGGRRGGGGWGGRGRGGVGSLDSARVAFAAAANCASEEQASENFR